MVVRALVSRGPTLFLQPSALLIADEQDDLAKISSLKKQVSELYQAGKLSEAIPIAQESLELSEKALGPDHPDTALALNNLAKLYHSWAITPKPNRFISAR